MKKNFIIVLLTIIALATSCKDAIICTDCDNNKKDTIKVDTSKYEADKYFNKIWYLDSCFTDSVFALKAFKIYYEKAKFADSTVYFLEEYDFQGITKYSSNYMYNLSITSDGRKFKLGDYTNNIVYSILNYSETSLTLGKSTNNGISFMTEAVYRNVTTPRNPKYNKLSIRGDIYNPNKLNIGMNPQVYLVFKVKKSDNKEIIYNYKQGTILKTGIYGLSYNFDLTQDLPKNVVIETSKGGQLAFGEIILTSQPIPLDEDVSTYLKNKSIFLGGVNNYGLVWKSGQFSDGSNFNWKDSFNDGFSIGLYNGTMNPLEPTNPNKVWIIPNYWNHPHKTNLYASNLTLWVTNDYNEIRYPNGWYY